MLKRSKKKQEIHICNYFFANFNNKVVGIFFVIKIRPFFLHEFKKERLSKSAWEFLENVI